MPQHGNGSGVSSSPGSSSSSRENVQQEENHAAHNKYDARSLPQHHLHGTRGAHGSSTSGGSRNDPLDQTRSTRDSARLHHSHHHGPSSGHHAAVAGHATNSHQNNPHVDSDSAVLHPKFPATSGGKREKARQKLSSSLKNKAKMVATDSRNTHPYKVPVQIGGVVPDRFRILKIKAVIDKKPTTVDERSSAVLKYRTPHFRAMGTIEVPPLKDGQRVQVGFIQACTHMRFINTYGTEGITSWEFPEIVSGKYHMIGDADGKQYPWYGSRLELSTVQGPSSTQAVTIHMNDNFFPQVTWYIPHPEYDKTPRLTSIHRKQRFYTFIVVKDVNTSQYHVLKTIEWAMELNIQVHPDRPLGSRAILCPPTEQEQPTILQHNSVRLEPYALNPPNANNAQTLIWRPNDGTPKIIVPPVETTMDMERYLLATQSYNLALTNGHPGGHFRQ